MRIERLKKKLFICYLACSLLLLIAPFGGSGGMAAASEEAVLAAFVIDNDTNGTKDGFPVTVQGFEQTGFSYSSSSSVSGYAGKSHFTSASAAEAKWTPQESGQSFGIGTYRVSVFVPKRPSAYGIAEVEVYRDGKSEAREINLADITSISGEWVELGIYDFMGKGHEEYVRLKRDASSPAGSFVHADAVKFEKLHSRIAALSSLTLNNTTILEDGRAAYAYLFPRETETVTLDAIAVDHSAAISVSVNGMIVSTPPSESIPILLARGNNEVEIIVTAQNQVFQKRYTLTLKRATSSSSNAKLRQLLVDETEAERSKGLDVFTHRVKGSTETVRLTVKPNHPEAFVTVNGVYVQNGTATVPIALEEGNNAIAVRVTAPDAATIQQYTLNLYRERTDAMLADLRAGASGLVSPAADPPVFDPAVTEYAYGAPNGADSMTLVPTSHDPHAEIYVAGEKVNSGTASSPIALTPGVHTIPVLVKAEDRSITKAYTVYAGSGDYAAGKPALASQAYLLAPASAALDGSGTTAWRNLSFDAHPYVWLEVDLGNRYTLDEAVLTLYNPADASGFKLQASDDGKQWTDLYVRNGSPAILEILAFEPVTARYVRYYADKARELAYTGLYSLEVYGDEPPSPDLASDYERLAGLQVSEGKLAFEPYRKRYTVTANTDVTVTAIKADEGQSIRINGNLTESLTIDRASMPESVKVEVTSKDGQRSLAYEIGLEQPPFEPDSGYALEFADEFSGSGVNEEEWYYRYGVSRYSDNRKENVTVSDGELHIALKKERSNGAEYTAGGVISKREMDYGYYETRAKLWGNPGFHTSFWQAGLNERVAVLDGDDVVYGASDNQVNEIDGFEIDSHDPGLIRTAGHHWYPGDAHVVFGSYEEYSGVNSADGYHVYGWEWTPTHVKFFIDGELIRVMDYPGPHAAGQNVWLTSIAYTLPVDEASLPGEVTFDYFRYYKKEDQGPFPAGSVIVDNGDAGYSDSGSWSTVTEAFGSDDRETRLSSSPGDWARWMPDMTEAGDYEVWVWNPAFYNNTNYAKYTVTAEDANHEAVVDQGYGGQQWISLGTYSFPAGSAGSVTLTVTEGMAHRADAVMFVPVQD